jgi:lysophospholipase L1-like esterase
MIRWNLIFCLIFISIVSRSGRALAEGAPLSDRNNDGQIEVIAFGDSITYGVGDGTEPGQYVSQIDEVGDPRGYPLRLSSVLAVPVLNAGVPGETVIGIPGPRVAGVVRFPEVAVGGTADLVIIFEGINDARYDISATELEAGYQKMINVARADNKNVAIATLLPPTVERGILAPTAALYSETIRGLGAMNGILVIDLEQDFLRDCPDLSTCPYYNLPEGLHPNTVGYDALTRMIATAIQR